MFVKRIVYILFCCQLWLLSFAYAEGSNDNFHRWRAWLYDGDGNMVMIDDEGDILASLTLPNTYDLVHISSDGRFVRLYDVEAQETVTFDTITEDIVPSNANHQYLEIPQDADLFSYSNELIFTSSDERFSGLRDQSGQLYNNTLYVYDPIITAEFPFYCNPYLRLSSSYFVQNGQRVLLHGYDANDIGHWLLIRRDGSFVRPLRNLDRRDIHDTLKGFIYALTNADGDTEIVEYNAYIPLSDYAVWRGDGYWEIAWLDAHIDSYGPFLAWAQLATPVYNNYVTGTVTETIPYSTQPILVLSPGDEAIIQTFDGEILNMRDAPGDGKIILYLSNNQRVTIVDGPVYIDTHIWWNVRTGNGTEGWAVQAHEDVTTLLLYAQIPRDLYAPDE